MKNQKTQGEKMSEKKENIKLLMLLVKAENSIANIWLTLEENPNAFDHVNIEDIVQDVHKIRNKLAKAIGYEIIYGKTNVIDEALNNENTWKSLNKED